MNTFSQFLEYHAQKNPRGIALRHKRRGAWLAWSWQAAAAEVRVTACGLAAIGAEPGDRIVFIGQNIPEFYWTLTASQCLGCVPVPVDVDIQRHELAAILNRQRVGIAIVRDQQYVDLLLSVKSECPSLREIIFVEARGLRGHEYSLLKSFAKLQEAGGRFDRDQPTFYADALGRLREDHLAIVLYTAGTTAEPKAVGLSHSNLVNTARGIVKEEKLREQDEIMAYLPMSWASSIVFAYSIWMVAGSTLNCPESERTLFDNMREIRPTFFYAPPKIYKRLLTISHLRMSSSPRLDKYIFSRAYQAALRIGEKRFRGEQLSLADKLVSRTIRLLVFDAWKKIFGLSRIRIALTGVETISPDILIFFRAIGVNLKQCYGLTEGSACVAINPDNNVKWNVIGRAINGIEIKLDSNSRILLRGSYLQSFYHQSSQSMRPTNEDGWLRTDDLGELDANGDIRIVGRYETSEFGESASFRSAAVIESILKSSPYIKDAVVFARTENALVAFLSVDEEVITDWANRRNFSHRGYADLISHEAVHEMITDLIGDANRKIASIVQDDDLSVTRFLILPRTLDKRAGELTRYWTICRRIVAENFASLIEALYSDQSKAIFVDRCEQYELRLVDIRAVVCPIDVNDVPPLNANHVRLSNA